MDLLKKADGANGFWLFLLVQASGIEQCIRIARNFWFLEKKAKTEWERPKDKDVEHFKSIVFGLT